jgi:hypothetical protein
MTPDAEILLLIMAANGGEMDEADARREWHRVLALSPEARAEWRRRIMPLVQAHARRHLTGRDE